MSRYLTSGQTRVQFLADLARIAPADAADLAHTSAKELRALVEARVIPCPRGWTVTRVTVTPVVARLPRASAPAKPAPARPHARTPFVAMVERKTSDIAYVGDMPVLVKAWTDAFEMALKLSAVKVGRGRRQISLLAFSRVRFLDASTGRVASHGEHLRLRGMTPREAATALVEMFQG